MPMSWAGSWSTSIQGFVEFRIEDIIIGLSEQSEGWTGPDDEYPHYAFYLNGPNFELMKTLARCATACPTIPIGEAILRLSTSAIPPAISSSFTAIAATRGYCLCHQRPDAAGKPIDFRALNYHWNSKGAALDTRQKYTETAAHGFCSREHFLPRSRTGEAFLHDRHRWRAHTRRRRIRRGARCRDYHRANGSSRPADRAERRISPLRFFVEPEDFLPMVAWLPPKRRHNLRAVDAGWHQGSSLLSRPRGKSLRDVLSESSKKRTPSCAAQNRAAATQSTLPV